jgi:hypothetical protein
MLPIHLLLGLPSGLFPSGEISTNIGIKLKFTKQR